MKLIRAHDILPRRAVGPDFRSLRRIVTAFVATMALCFSICVVLIFHEGHAQRITSKIVLAIYSGPLYGGNYIAE